MQLQAGSGEILLYEGQHGVEHTADLGRLVESQITPEGDWITIYRLYDSFDNVGPIKLERAETLWNQVNGLPPYKKAIQKGFSIEGYIPDEGIIEMSESGQRVIDSVDLDGVLVTPRPSYKSSVITAVYKALGELSPEREIFLSEKIKNELASNLLNEELKHNYHSKRIRIEDMFNDMIEKYVNQGDLLRQKLVLLFAQYTELMINLIVENADILRTIEKRPADQPDIPDESGAVDVAKAQRTRMLNTIEDLALAYKAQLNKKGRSENDQHSNKRTRSK